MGLDPERSHFPLQSPAPVPAEAPSASVGILAQDFRVVCDNMLQGLGRSLRCLGVDVRILGNEEEHRRAAEVGGRWAESPRVGGGSCQGRLAEQSGLRFNSQESPGASKGRAAYSPCEEQRPRG